MPAENGSLSGAIREDTPSGLQNKKPMSSANDDDDDDDESVLRGVLELIPMNLRVCSFCWLFVRICNKLLILIERSGEGDDDDKDKLKRLEQLDDR